MATCSNKAGKTVGMLERRTKNKVHFFLPLQRRAQSETKEK